MRRTALRGVSMLVLAGVLMAGPALAEKPEWAGGGKGGKHVKKDRDRDERAPRDSVPTYFSDRHRVVVHDYYGEQFRAGRCPPGLAKKRNGCMPPGQAKKWRMGRPLPREVVYYEVPSEIIVHLGVPPSGHRYVRVATDILLIAIGTGMVVDAIQDLGRM